VNECVDYKGRCTAHSTCKNTPGSYSCVCDIGYRAEGSLCVGQLNSSCFTSSPTRAMQMLLNIQPHLKRVVKYRPS